MAATRKQSLEAMAVTLDLWKSQITDLQAKARTAGAERQRVMRDQIVVLRQRRSAYDTQRTQTSGASTAVFRDMLAGSERMAEEFRKLYLQTVSRFSD